MLRFWIGSFTTQYRWTAAPGLVLRSVAVLLDWLTTARALSRISQDGAGASGSGKWGGQPENWLSGIPNAVRVQSFFISLYFSFFGLGYDTRPQTFDALFVRDFSSVCLRCACSLSRRLCVRGATAPFF